MNLTYIPFALVSFYIYSFLSISVFLIQTPLNLWIIIESITFVFMGTRCLTMVKESQHTEGILGYYIMQSGLSIVALHLMLFMEWFPNVVIIPFMLVLLAKLGVFPMNFWFYPILIKLHLLRLLIVITFQKIPVLLFFKFWDIGSSNTLIFLIFLNLLVGGITTLFSSDIKSLIVSSSLANNSWLLLVFISRITVFIVFMLLYICTLVYSLFFPPISKFAILTLSGLPPFPLFYLKFLVLYCFFFIEGDLFIEILGVLYIFIALLLSASYVRYFIKTYIRDHISYVS